MNQKGKYGWIVGAFFAWFIWGIVFFVVNHLLFPLDFIDDVLYGVMISFGFIVGVVWEIKRPSKTNRDNLVRTLVLIVVILALSFFFTGYLHDEIYEMTNPHFKIADISYTYEYGMGYSYHAKIWNDGKEGTEYIYCYVTKSDLTTVSKNQQVYLHRNEEVVIHMFFAEDEVGEVWKEYWFHIGS